MKRILVVDDNQENRYLLDALLRGYGYEVVSAENGAEALGLARSSAPDLIVADILMPVMDGYTLCREWKSDPVLECIPFIFYTATYTEPEDQEFALSLGAERFLIKPVEPTELAEIVEEVLERSSETWSPQKPDKEFFEDYSKALFRKLEKKTTDVEHLKQRLSIETVERRKLEELVHKCEAKLQDALDAAPLAMVWTDTQGGMLGINKEFLNRFGYELTDLPTIETLLSVACPDQVARSKIERLWEVASDANRSCSASAAPIEAPLVCKDGTLRSVSVLEAVMGDIRMAAFIDLTEKKTLESQLFQAQKMEAIAHLAGGLAHDFNNVLTAIVGYGQLLLTNLPTEGKQRGYVEQILNASDRASKLTRNIFSFSRKQSAEEKPLKLNQVVNGVWTILSRLVRETVVLNMDLCAEDVTLMGDPIQLEQILMNLVTNASHAIEGSGSIMIGTEMVLLDNEFISADGSRAEGPYALLTVTDTGHGMDEETRRNIFKPFFTTKEKEKGTGLGLSMVYGIVRRHNGHILVRSEPSKGTTFSIYFPALRALDTHDEAKREYMTVGGSETILLAEDDEISSRAIALNLKEMGYQVIEAYDGEQAVSMLKMHGQLIGLILIDLVMPKMNGWEVYQQAVGMYSEVKAIFMSGYADESSVTQMIRDKNLDLLPKPISPALLLAKVRELLDRQF